VNPASVQESSLEHFYNEGGETPEGVAQRGGRCPIPRKIQGQVGWSSEHPDLVEVVPAHCRGVGLHVPSNAKHFMILFYDSVILSH